MSLRHVCSNNAFVQALLAAETFNVQTSLFLLFFLYKALFIYEYNQCKFSYTTLLLMITALCCQNN